jgi:cell division protein FtsB
MEALKWFSDAELKAEYLKSKDQIAKLHRELKRISISDTENQTKIEDELDDEKDFLAKIAVEIVNRLYADDLKKA